MCKLGAHTNLVEERNKVGYVGNEQFRRLPGHTSNGDDPRDLGRVARGGYDRVGVVCEHRVYFLLSQTVSERI